MKCDICYKSFDDSYTFCPYCGHKVDIHNLASVEQGNQNKSPKQKLEFDKPNWGCHINSNLYLRHEPQDIPQWARPAQKIDWEKRGVIVWDDVTQTITLLWAEQALSILEELRKKDNWKTTGITIGEPAVEIEIDSKGKGDETKKPNQWVLTNKIKLTGSQTQEFFGFLETNESHLREIAEREGKERSNTLDRVYRLLLGDELWAALGKIYASDPNMAVRMAQEALETVMGSDKKPNEAQVEKPRRKKRSTKTELN